MLTSRNQLPPLEAVERSSFETMWANFKVDFIANLAEVDPVAAAEVEQVLAVEAELISKLGQTFCQYLIAHIERINEQARQMLPGFARKSNLDHVVAFQSLERQTISPGDPSAFPPVPEVKESDDQLLLRYWLAPHGPAAGSKLSYRYHCMTLGQRPKISVHKPDSTQVVVTYTLPESSTAANVKDASAERTSPGQVTLSILSSDGDGAPSVGLLDEVREYFRRDDVRPETDLVIVQGATLLPYKMEVTCQVQKGPDTRVFKTAVEKELQAYAISQHGLGQKIERSYMIFLLHKAGVSSPVIVHPVADVVALSTQAPYCTDVKVTVQVV